MTATGDPGVHPSLNDTEGSLRPVRPVETRFGSGLYEDTHFKKPKLHSSDSNALPITAFQRRGGNKAREGA